MEQPGAEEAAVVAGGGEDGKLRRRLDELYTAHPFYGSRRMTLVLREEGWIVNRKRVRRLMRLRGIEALLAVRVNVVAARVS